MQRSTLASVILAVSVSNFAVAALAAIPPSEREVLLDLYDSTGGSDWTSHAGWGGAPGSECSWFGVVCDDVGAHVTYISLGNNHLVGTLPASLSPLAALKFFTIEDNELTGPLPSFAGMTNFQALFASSNQLSGTIPPLQGLTSLEYFYVDENRLTGPLPSLAGMTSLHFFFVSSNELTGPMPELTGLANLEVIAVDGNRLTGTLAPFEALPALRAFVATGNQLTGVIPPLTELVSLDTFAVDGNRLSGPPPALPAPNGLHPEYLASKSSSDRRLAAPLR